MKMLVFYRSREYTNAIISSTRYKLQNMDIAKGLDVDKPRNLAKSVTVE